MSNNVLFFGTIVDCAFKLVIGKLGDVLAISNDHIEHFSQGFIYSTGNCDTPA